MKHNTIKFLAFIKKRKIKQLVLDIINGKHDSDIISFLYNRTSEDYILDLLIRDVNSLEKVEFWVNLDNEWQKELLP